VRERKHALRQRIELASHHDLEPHRVPCESVRAIVWPAPELGFDWTLRSMDAEDSRQRPRVEIRLLRYRHPQSIRDRDKARFNKSEFKHACFTSQISKPTTAAAHLSPDPKAS
jgi:hypothetical protein